MIQFFTWQTDQAASIIAIGPTQIVSPFSRKWPYAIKVLVQRLATFSPARSQNERSIAIP